MSAEIDNFINSVLNQPWARDGRNCWRLTRDVIGILGYKLPLVLEVAPSGKEGRELKAELFSNHPERANWEFVDNPNNWALVFMHRPFRKAAMIEHAGVYFADKGGRILHTCDPYGVVYDTIAELKVRNWVPTFLVPK